MKQQLEVIRAAALDAIAETKAAEDLAALRVKYLGKKGELTAVLKQMGKLSAEERPVMGQLANDVRAALEKAIESQSAVLAEAAMAAKLESETLDVSIPGKEVTLGHKHPMYAVLDEIKEIFLNMGFEIFDGPEVETEDYNFTKLNTPADHPAREWSDTFYLTEEEIRQEPDTVRHMAVAGHRIGILLTGSGDPLGELRSANEALFLACGGKTRLCAAESGEVRAESLRAAGYCLLSPKVDGSVRGLYTGSAETLFTTAQNKRGSVTVWLGESVSAGGLQRFLTLALDAQDRLLGMTERDN